MKRLIIIDDEPIARDALRSLLAVHLDIEVVGEAGTLTDARLQLARSGYDLVLLDIQLRGGSGFDLVPLVRPGARIIFVTAHDEHAVRAFTVNALDYLLKPVVPERLAVALARLAPDSQPSSLNSQLAPLPAPLSPLLLEDRVHLKLGGGTERFVRVGEIRCIQSEENYTAVHVGAPAERLLVRRTLQSWEDQLPSSHFVRVHRQTLVNAAHVHGVARVTVDVSHLTVQGMAQPVVASQRYLAELRQHLAQLRD
ncbi:MAG: response regulator [Candidatus Didemnitutus sp.]|nr:response regulator [Candidatus Didemnitutus sp.]